MQQSPSLFELQDVSSRDVPDPGVVELTKVLSEAAIRY